MLLGGGKVREGALQENEQSSRQIKEPAKKTITLKVGRETAGRRGKGVTTVFDVPMDEDGLLELAAKLKPLRNRRHGEGWTHRNPG
jgi:translation initiation factor 1 (eIF-1/SUI1)